MRVVVACFALETEIVEVGLAEMEGDEAGRGEGLVV